MILLHFISRVRLDGFREVKMKKVSLIIPVYNEEKAIKACLESLFKQSYKNIEIILIDDGSTDNTRQVITNYPSTSLRASKSKITNLKLLHQQHKGPGVARNLGASKSTGEILVFVDADMTFDKDFIKDLVQPIINGKTIGTFSKNEMVSNDKNPWSVCWNINRGVPADRMLPGNYPNFAPVFRAILKSEFNRVGGFETTGQYTDDWSLSQKLGAKSTAAPGAIYYHTNPSTLKEVWHQARWIGKNSFLSGNVLRIIKSFLLYNPTASVIIGLYKSTKYKNFQFLIFKLTYDLAVLTSVIKSFSSEPKYK